MINQILLDVSGGIISMFLYVIIIGGYFGLCYLVAKQAEKRGRDFWLFLFIAIVLNPIIGIIIVVLLGDSDEVRQEKIRREVKQALEEERNNQQTS